jgi:hypothetical protein
MITLTPQERALWNELRTLASGLTTIDAEEHCISYKQLGRRVDPNGTWHYPMTRPPFRGLNEALGHVSKYEAAHGRPLLSALVVNEDTRKPGSGFVNMAVTDLRREVADPDEFWREELARVVSFWTADDQVLLIDTAIGQVLTELVAVKRQLRQIAARLGQRETES